MVKIKDINLVLPIYHKFDDRTAKVTTYKKVNDIKVVKNKKGDLIKGKTILINMNWYRNAHHIEQNDVKKIYSDLIQNQFRDMEINRMLVDIKYEVHYKLYYKSSACDMPNITAMMSKFLNDAIQELGLVKNDNVKFLVREVHEVVGEDKENPRCEIVIKEIKEF